MSAIPTNLKAPSDLNLFFETQIIDFTTAQVRIDSLLQFNQLIKAVRITNNDALANVTFRVGSPSGLLRTIPLSSSGALTEWTSYLEINPSAVSGSGQIEIDLVPLVDARLAVAMNNIPRFLL